MNSNQVIYAIYNYLFMELSRLDIQLKERSKNLQSFNGSSSYIYRYWKAKKELEDFEKFSTEIFSILKFYEE